MPTKRRRYTFPDRGSAEEAVERERQRATVANICLCEVVQNNVAWFERGHYRIGLIRPDSPTGGYAVVTWCPPGQKPSSNAWYLDELAQTYSTGWYANLGGDKDAHDLVHLIVLVVVKRDELAGYAHRREVTA